LQAVDTNVLVYARVAASRHHRRAREVVEALSQGDYTWALPWPCVYEFLRIVTHPAIYHPPVPLHVALADLQALLASPSLVLLSQTSRHAEVMERVVRGAGAPGNLIYDAQIAALCLEHGVTELITGDRDFTRFQDLRIFNPFSET
jgi:hypothetical protein